eukprot:3147464-Rhodomonas_salina.1
MVQATLSTIMGYIQGTLSEAWFTQMFMWLSVLSIIVSDPCPPTPCGTAGAAVRFAGMSACAGMRALHGTPRTSRSLAVSHAWSPPSPFSRPAPFLLLTLKRAATHSLLVPSTLPRRAPLLAPPLPHPPQPAAIAPLVDAITGLFKMGSFCCTFACSLGGAASTAAKAGLLVAAGPSLPAFFFLPLALPRALTSLALSIGRPFPPHVSLCHLAIRRPPLLGVRTPQTRHSGGE